MIAQIDEQHAAMIARLSGLPVNGDLEDGFGPAPEDCVATVEASIAAGLAGLGIEDTTADPARPIHDFDHAVARIAAAAKAASGRIVLTARTDNFLHGRPDLDDTIRRLVAFAEVGADVLYAPGLPDMASIEAVVRAVAPRPVNVVFGPRSGPVPLAVLDGNGELVKRLTVHPPASPPHPIGVSHSVGHSAWHTAARTAHWSTHEPEKLPPHSVMTH